MKSTTFEGRSAEMKKDTPWLASEDIMGMGDVPVTITGCYLHRNAQFDDGRKEDVYALAFEGKKKQLVLNATNRKTLVDWFGPNVPDWIGKGVKLHVVRLKAWGEWTNGIRIKQRED